MAKKITKLTKNAAFYLGKCIWWPLVKDFMPNHHPPSDHYPRALIWAFPYQSQLAFFKANTSAKKSKVLPVSKPRHIHVQVARSANARETPLEQWKSNLSESSSLAWVIAKRESWAEPARGAKRLKVQRGARMPGQRRAGKLVHNKGSASALPIIFCDRSWPDA